MSRQTKIAVWTVFSLVVVAALVVLVFSFNRSPYQSLPDVLEGAVVVDSDNSHRQAPIPNVAITAMGAGYTTMAKSEISGLFRLPLAREWRTGQYITLTFRAPDFKPLQETFAPSQELFIARMKPVERAEVSERTGPQTAIANVRIRYSTEFLNTSNIGSIAPTLDIVNTGNVACDAEGPCSPDGRWKAAIGSKTLDAGADNQYVNTRVSCIAGPCPFTKLEDDSYAQPARVINVRVRNWSDTTTFLIEAEVSRSQRSNYVREAYPAIFGQAMTFTMPPKAQGLSIEAELNGHPIVFPMGPALQLSWAACNAEKESDNSTLFRCELKRGYYFQPQPASSN